jgi:hypothetical protein
VGKNPGWVLTQTVKWRTNSKKVNNATNSRDNNAKKLKRFSFNRVDPRGKILRMGILITTTVKKAIME